MVAEHKFASRCSEASCRIPIALKRARRQFRSRMIAALVLASTFPGNGLYCFGSPAATGEILPFGKDQYVVEIAVMLRGRTREPVGWLYTSNEGKRFVQRGANDPVKPYARTADDFGVRLFKCTFPMPLEQMP
jgi:hypothetical protein